MNYQIETTPKFQRSYNSQAKNNLKLAWRIESKITILKDYPFHSSLRTHQIDSDKYAGKVWSSRITGDIRIIWTFHPAIKNTIVLLKIGGHDDVY